MRTGDVTLVIVDEGWLALNDPTFGAQLREWLKTLRKKNASVVFATQSLADIDGSANQLRPERASGRTRARAPQKEPARHLRPCHQLVSGVRRMTHARLTLPLLLLSATALSGCAILNKREVPSVAQIPASFRHSR